MWSTLIPFGHVYEQILLDRNLSVFFCFHNFCMANDSSTLPVQFELCGEAQSNAIHQLNARPKSVATIVNNKTAKVIFAQLDGASLMISCDAEEKRMVIERTEEEGDLAYGLRG